MRTIITASMRQTHDWEYSVRQWKRAMNAAHMPSEEPTNAPAITVTRWTSSDVTRILSERGWLTTDPTPEIEGWYGHAAAILGAHAPERAALAELLALVFHYEAGKIMGRVETHEVLAR